MLSRRKPLIWLLVVHKVSPFLNFSSFPCGSLDKEIHQPEWHTISMWVDTASLGKSVKVVLFHTAAFKFGSGLDC